MAEVRPRIFSAAHVAKKAYVVVPAMRTNVPDNLAVNRARDAVLQLEVHLGNRVLREHRGVRDITWKTTQVSLIHDRKPQDVEVKRFAAASPALTRIYVRMAADSTMLRMVNRLMALSLGVHREQLEHRMGLTWPRPVMDSVSGSCESKPFAGDQCSPFLLRPLFFLFLTILTVSCVSWLSRGCVGEGRAVQKFRWRWKTGVQDPP